MILLSDHVVLRVLLHFEPSQITAGPGWCQWSLGECPGITTLDTWWRIVISSILIVQKQTGAAFPSDAFVLLRLLS